MQAFIDGFKLHYCGIIPIDKRQEGVAQKKVLALIEASLQRALRLLIKDETIVDNSE